MVTLEKLVIALKQRAEKAEAELKEEKRRNQIVEDSILVKNSELKIYLEKAEAKVKELEAERDKRRIDGNESEAEMLERLGMYRHPRTGEYLIKG